MADHFKKLAAESKKLKQLVKECIKREMAEAPLGKKVADSLYIHRDYLSTLPRNLLHRVKVAETFSHSMREDTAPGSYTIVKISLCGNISFLWYPEFDTEAHPALTAALVVTVPDRLKGLHCKKFIYRNPGVRWVLHRKETMVGEDYPYYKLFASLTKAEEDAGLLDKPPGLLAAWNNFLSQKRYSINGHTLAKIMEPIFSSGSIIYDEWDDSKEDLERLPPPPPLPED